MRLFVDRMKELGYALLVGVLAVMFYSGWILLLYWLLNVVTFNIGTWIVALITAYFAMWILCMFVNWLVIEPVKSSKAHYKWTHRNRK